MSKKFIPYGEEDKYEDDDDYFFQQTHGSDWAKEAWLAPSNYLVSEEE
jgi:hypothetical protein